MASNRPRAAPPVPAEEELLRVRQRLMDLAGIGMYRYALDGTVLHMDAMTLRVLDLEADYPEPALVVGQDIASLFEYVERPARVREQVLREGRVQGLEYSFRTRYGRHKWCLHDAYLVIDEQTGEEAIQVLSRDITDLKTIQKRLEAANEELAGANSQLRTLDELKTSLLANVSHELRSPLVTIRGYADLIRAGESGPVTDTQRRQLDVVLHNVDRLAALIEDLIQAARAQSEAPPLTVGAGELHGLLEAAIASLEPKRRTRGVTVEAAFHAEPIPIRADLRLITQVVVNLLDNAIKFTPAAGRVEVGSALLAPEHVEIRVSDTGIGIPPEAQERIFERFFQVDSSSTRSYAGLGLGLAISREIVARHGGTLTVASAPGKGSTFRVTLPRRAPVTG